MKNISLMYLLQLAWKRIWLLIIAMVVFAVAAFGYCKFFAEKRYAASSRILVTNGNLVGDAGEDEIDAAQGSDISASLSLTNNVVGLFQTGKIYEAFAEEYGEKYGIENGSTFKGMISAARNDNINSYIDITVSSNDPELAVKIANDFADFVCVDDKENGYIKSVFKKSEVVFVDDARHASRTAPRTTFITGIASIVGVVAMYLIIFIFDSLNQSIRGEEEFAMRFDVPIIGTVPDFTDTEVIDSYYSKKGVYSNAK